VEILSYVANIGKELTTLEENSRVMRVFRKFNCMILSSASAERQFSAGGGIFTLKQNILGDSMFENF